MVRRRGRQERAALYDLSADHPPPLVPADRIVGVPERIAPEGIVRPLTPAAAAKYDLLLRGGHVIDARNNVDAVRDVAIAGGKIALVAASIPAADAGKTIDVSGLYVTPGLIDIHTHVYTGTGEPNSYAGDNSVYPDGFTFRVGVTTVADAGGSGWRNFEDFKTRVIDRAKTRVLAFLNIVGNGMRGAKFESDQADMDAQAAAAMALKHKGTIVGIKTAHYTGPEWTPVEHAVEAGTAAGIPVMVDFGNNHPDTRPLADQPLGNSRCVHAPARTRV